MSETRGPLVETIPRRQKSTSSQRSSRSSCSSRASQSTSHKRMRAKAMNTDCAPSRTCAPHAPLLPATSRAAPIVLEPPPNTRTLSTCVADDTLVTTHRNGLRLYRPAAVGDGTDGCDGRGDPQLSAPQGVWTLVEVRDTFDLRDTYLCAPAQPLVTRKRGLFRSKYTRYFCVASGNDRSVHSLSVGSTRAHFTVQHTEHQRNRICAMHLAQVAVQPFCDDAFIALAVSADEVGGLCLLDVEQERAFPLLEATRRPPTAGLTAETVQSWLHAVTSARGTSNEFGDSQSTPFRFLDGAITKVALVGPCLELCRGCQNACCPEAGPSASTVRRPPLLLVSVIVTARGQDVGTENTTEAQLHASLLRVALTDQGAYVMWHSRLVDAVAPVPLCEMGPALCVPPHADNEPTAALVGGPRLSIEARRGCTGDLMHTYVSPSPTSREASEYFVQWVPLGYRRLTPGGTGHVSPSSLPCPGDVEAAAQWRCALALTSESAVLIIGIAGPAREAQCQTAVMEPGTRSSVGADEQPICSKEESPLDGAAALSGWLDDIELPGASPVVASPPLCLPSEHAGHIAPYTTLAELFSPREGAQAQRIKSVSVDWRQNAAMLLLADNETLLSVALPLSPPLPSSTGDGAQKVGTTSREESVPGAGLVGSVWESTSKGLAAVASVSSGTAQWVTPSRWTTSALSRWRGTSSESPTAAEAPVPESSVNEASAVPVADASSPHRYSLVRPIAVALASLASGYASPFAPPVPTSAVTEKREGSVARDVTAEKGTLVSEASPRQDVVSVPPSPAVEAGPHTPLPDAVSSGISDHTTPSSPRSAAASQADHVAIRASSTGSAVHHGRRRKHTKKKPAASTSVRSVMSIGSSHGEMDAYMTAKVHQACKAISEGRSPPRLGQTSFLSTQLSGDQADGGDRTDEEMRRRQSGLADGVLYAIQQLADVEEPLARNAVLYAWRDAHDTLFIQETISREHLESAVKSVAAAAEVRAAELAALYGRCAAPDAAQGKHSLRFLAAVDDMMTHRQRTCDRRGRFGFEDYFTTGNVPQHLLDLQEQDKCRFELRDMEREQAMALEALSPDSVVEILQNEEKRALVGTAGRTRWESHATFPYDDKDGQAVDLLLLNQHADTKTISEWRWKTEADTSAAAAGAAARAQSEVASSRHRLPQVVAKELKGWTVGPWQYAAHWPTTPQERQDPHFWSDKDSPQFKVRCRLLCRTRVHIPTDTKRRHRMAEHARQLESLRIELGL